MSRLLNDKEALMEKLNRNSLNLRENSRKKSDEEPVKDEEIQNPNSAV